MNTEYQYQKCLSRLLKLLNVTVEELQSGCREPRLVDARSMVAASLIEFPKMRQVDIALILNTSQAAVSKLLNRHQNLLEGDLRYRRRWQSFADEVNMY